MRILLGALIALTFIACNSTPTPEKACDHMSKLPVGKGRDRGFQYDQCVRSLTRILQQNPTGYRPFVDCILRAQTLVEAENNCVPPR
jgi:hypothetical protein